MGNVDFRQFAGEVIERSPSGCPADRSMIAPGSH
jgi:hypothetical protein